MDSPESLENLLAQVPDAALVIDESGTVIFVNDQACQLLKYVPGELHGQIVELLIPGRYRLAHIGHRLRFTDDHRTRPMGVGLELFAVCKDGSECPVDIGLSPVRRGLETLVLATIRVRKRFPSN